MLNPPPSPSRGPAPSAPATALPHINTILKRLEPVQLSSRGGWTEEGDHLERLIPMVAAVVLDDVEAIQTLVEHGFNVNEMCYGSFQTAVYKAASTGKIASLRRLLALGADIDIARVEDRAGRSITHAAAVNGQAACLAVLRKHGCDMGLLDGNGCTAAWHAARKGHAGALSVLISSQSANIHISCAGGRHGTALDVAQIMGRKECVKLLAAAGMPRSLPA